jgi:hypothetical protein
VGWVYPGYWVLLLTRLIPMDGWLAGLAYAGLRDNGYKECVYVVGESSVHKVVMNTHRFPLIFLLFLISWLAFYTSIFFIRTLQNPEFVVRGVGFGSCKYLLL